MATPYYDKARALAGPYVTKVGDMAGPYVTKAGGVLPSVTTAPSLGPE